MWIDAVVLKPRGTYGRFILLRTPPFFMCSRQYNAHVSIFYINFFLINCFSADVLMHVIIAKYFVGYEEFRLSIIIFKTLNHFKNVKSMHGSR